MEHTWEFHTELIIGPLAQVLQFLQYWKYERFYCYDGCEYWLALSDSRGMGTPPWSDEQVWKDLKKK